MRRALLRWYDAHARDLPWRRTRDPYAIWISEVMLQQTRVETVLRYYERFLARFPDPATLARAPEDEVLAAWSGLGYYRRARMLHRGAQHLVAHHGGQVPRDRAARLAMPGVGRYTAGAIGSIAFDLPEPIVDGNVARVLARVHALETPLDARETIDALWERATALAETTRPGALNQALMELGAIVCTPTTPRCDDCPIRARCDAHATDRTDTLPVPKRRRPPRAVDLVAVVARSGARVALVRAEAELFGGLWNVPMREGRSHASARELVAELALRTALPSRPQARVEHVLTHRHLTIRVFACELEAHDPARARLVDPAELASTLGVSALTRKILSATSS